MALTINTHPDEVITNAPKFDVSTSLTESASYQNLRIRATVYIGGVSTPVAVLEQSKGLDDWDFFKTLKSLIGKSNIAVGGSSGIHTPGLSAEKLTGWTDLLGTFETFTTLGRTITSAIDSNASGGAALGNDMGALSLGDIIIIGLEEDYNDSGVGNFALTLSGNVGLDLQSQTNYSGRSGGKLIANHIYPLMVIETLTTSFVSLTTGAGSNSALTGTATVRSISDFKNNPGVYFMVKFEEVYENVSDVTTIGAESWSDTLLFVPVVVRPGESFGDYFANGASGAKYALRQTDYPSSFTYITETKYKHGIGMEFRLLSLSTAPYILLRIMTPSGGPTDFQAVGAGWSITVLNDSTGPITVTDTFWYLQLLSINSAYTVSQYFVAVSYVFTELNCLPNPKVLSFISALGEETIIFKGLPSEAGGAEKSFIKDQNRIRKVLKAYKRTGEVLRTSFETEEIRRLLHELVYTELPVWMYNEDFTDNYREVTVLSDAVDIENQKQLIESAIEVEYYE